MLPYSWRSRCDSIIFLLIICMELDVSQARGEASCRMVAGCKAPSSLLVWIRTEEGTNVPSMGATCWIHFSSLYFPNYGHVSHIFRVSFQSTVFFILSVCVKNSLAGDAGKCLITHSLARNKSYDNISQFHESAPRLGWALSDAATFECPCSCKKPLTHTPGSNANKLIASPN